MGLLSIHPHVQWLEGALDIITPCNEDGKGTRVQIEVPGAPHHLAKRRRCLMDHSDTEKSLKSKNQKAPVLANRGFTVTQPQGYFSSSRSFLAASITAAAMLPGTTA